MADIINASIISAIFLLIFAVAEILRKFANLNTETTRKFVHFAGAFTALFFPFIFTSSRTILALAVAFGLIIVITKKYELLQSVHDIDRESKGAVYHPVAIYLCFMFAQYLQQPWFYVIAVAVLATSDALAALVGKTYGLKRFTVDANDKKSAEGSVIFFLSSFLIVHLILLLCTSTGRLESVLIALLIALIMTAFESVSINGVDNIFIPLGTIFILSKNTAPTIEALAGQILCLLVIVLLYLLLMKPYKKIGFSGVLLLGLMTYMALALGGWYFALCLFAISIICQKTNRVLIQDETKNEIFRVVPIFYILLVPMVWVFLADFNKIFFVPFFFSLVAQMLILWNWKRKSSGLEVKPLLLTDRIYWHFLNRNEWTQIEYLKMGLIASSLTSTLIAIGALYVQNFR
jgi:dolichol kinase